MLCFPFVFHSTAHLCLAMHMDCVFSLKVAIGASDGFVFESNLRYKMGKTYDSLISDLPIRVGV